MTQFENACRKAARMLAAADYAVFFGGAGISTDSGLADFRSRKGGLYNEPSGYGVPAEEILTPAFYEARTAEFFDYYRTKLLNLAAPPNSVHYALAELERAGLIKCVVTQNADDLHRRAGSRRVIDIHGNVYINTCPGCGKRFPPEVVADCEGVPRCECGGLIKPDVVLYEEGLDQNVIRGAVEAIASADTLIIGGTSLVVYPAAGFIDYFRGKHLVVINKSATGRAVRAELSISAPIGEIMSGIEVR